MKKALDENPVHGLTILCYSNKDQALAGEVKVRATVFVDNDGPAEANQVCDLLREFFREDPGVYADRGPTDDKVVNLHFADSGRAIMWSQLCYKGLPMISFSAD